MTIYLIQHGEAVDKKQDPDRPLTDEGRRSVTRVVEFASGAGITIPAVWHSGKTRARQTAEILAAHLAPKVAPMKQEGLTPKDDPARTAKLLENERTDLAIVGHMPHLSRLASLLITEKDDVEVVAFEHGGIVALQRTEARKWTVVWVLSPKLLSR